MTGMKRIAIQSPELGDGLDQYLAEGDIRLLLEMEKLGHPTGIAEMETLRSVALREGTFVDDIAILAEIWQRE